MNKIRPTKKQHEVLKFIENYITVYGYSPSYQEIADGLGVKSKATVALHIKNLIERGHISKRFNLSRSLEPTEYERRK
jgi:repressor LexA